MPSSFTTRWLLGWLFGAVAFAGCAAETSPTGDLSINLELVDGVEIDEVSYSITGNRIAPIKGTINTSAPGSTASVEIYGIPGGSKYTAAMSATSTDDETTCSGSANFNVVVGEITEVQVILKCKLGDELGGVRVNGEVNFCADLVWVDVSPLQTSIGNQIDVFARAADLDGDPFEYQWTGTGGTFADPSAQRTTFTCLEVGDQTITITVSDDGFDYCTCNRTVDVRCVEGDGTGGTGGMGGVGGEGGMGGMAGAGGMGGEGGTGGTAGTGGMGGEGGTGGTAGMGGEGGTGGTAGTGGTGGGGGCVPDGGAQWAGEATFRPCGEVSCAEMEACVDGACRPAALVFLSSSVSDAALGGPRGADRTCADLAADAGLGGYWFSWTSDSCTSPAQRFEQSTLPYRMVDGIEVSPSWDRMTMDPPPTGMGYLSMPIDLDEDGYLPVAPGECNTPSSESRGCFVWTNTNVSGEVAALGNNNGCLGLTTNDSMFAKSTAGKITSVSRGWTDGANWTCGTDTLRTYCFEQSTANP